jgi:hypothetical protein
MANSQFANESGSVPTPVAVKSKNLTKHLVLVSKPIYMGVYVAIDAESDADAISKLQQRIDAGDEIESRLTDLFGEMRITAHGAVHAEHNGFVNASMDSDYEVPQGQYHDELDMYGVVNPVVLAASENKNRETVHSLPVFDLTNSGYQTDAETELDRILTSVEETA